MAIEFGIGLVWGTLVVVGLLGCDSASPEGASRQPAKVAATAANGPRSAAPDVSSAVAAKPTTSARGQPSDRAAVPGGAPVRADDWILLTTAGASEQDTLPWIVGLHGLGDRPEQFKGLFSGLRFQAHVILPRGPLEHGRGYDWFGARVSGDPERLARGVRQATKQLAAQLRRLTTQKRFVGKPIVTGFSQGGILSFSLAVRHPDLVSASLPIGGWLPPQLSGEVPKGRVPIVAFHGEDDRVVPFSPTHELSSRLVAAGFDVQLRSYPGVGHHIDAAMHRDWESELARLCTAGRGRR